jgi:hypothetical protein
MSLRKSRPKYSPARFCQNYCISLEKKVAKNLGYMCHFQTTAQRKQVAQYIGEKPPNLVTLPGTHLERQLGTP